MAQPDNLQGETVSRNVLYRFYDEDDALLYIGISMSPWERFRQHRSDKPWWDNIRKTTMEPHPDRESVLEAERVAIVNEKPRYNIQHNQQGPDWCNGHETARANCGCEDVPVQRRRSPKSAPRWQAAKSEQRSLLVRGTAVALCMADGNCHVGLIEDVDPTFLRLQHKDWISGFYWGRMRLVRIADVVEFHLAERDDDGIILDDHFAGIQSAWTAAHRASA